MSQDCFDSVSKEKVIIVPCSGIGKAFGTVAREATYVVVEDLRKGVTATLCLSLLVMGDEKSIDLVKFGSVNLPRYVPLLLSRLPTIVLSI